VHRASAPITIDGKLDDKAWQAAPFVEFGFPPDRAFQTGLKQSTRAKFLWDAENLYVAYDCDDVDIIAHYTGRDEPVYRDDVVEIYINPRPALETAYYGLEMNARAVLYDYLNVRKTGIFKRFDMQGTRLATFLRGTLNAGGEKDEGWNLELAIPWVNFEEMARRPEPGTIWRANLNRWDGVGATQKERRHSTWAHPNNFGELIFLP
jgi:hypothetical protein